MSLIVAAVLLLATNTGAGNPAEGEAGAQAYGGSAGGVGLAEAPMVAVYPSADEPPPAQTLQFAAYSRDDPGASTFSVDHAADFIDGVAVKWGKKHGCVTCHTNGHYLMAPAELFHDRPAYAEVRDFAAEFVDSWDAAGVPDTEIAVATRAFLAISDAQMGMDLQPATLKALDEAWNQQSVEGHWVNWVKCNWPPFEQDDHYGVTLVAVAMGMAPASYTNADPARTGVKRLLTYLREYPPIEIHHKAMMLWAARYYPELVSEANALQWIRALSDLQRADGGWASGDLGRWRQLEGRPSDPPVLAESDGYGTGFVLFVLMQAGVPPSDPRIAKGVAWLKRNQQADGKWYTNSLRNEPDTSNFLTHTGTTFALKALVASGAAGNKAPQARQSRQSRHSESVLPYNVRY
jgi:squalene-hopene/tetraprenyl-beta-curcumene cyclase